MAELVYAVVGSRRGWASLLWGSSWWVFRGLWGESCGQGIPMGMRMKDILGFDATSLPFSRMSLPADL